MEVPIGTLVLSTEVGEGDLAISKTTFLSGHFYFFAQSKYDAERNKGKEMVKLVYTNVDLEMVKASMKAGPIKDFAYGSVISYCGKKYKILRSVYNTDHVQYLGPRVEEKTNCIGAALETDGAYAPCPANSWFNENTVVVLEKEP